jgi:hypothetical protein
MVVGISLVKTRICILSNEGYRFGSVIYNALFPEGEERHQLSYFK